MDFEEFTKDERTFDTVIRNFEIIGEAANRLDQAYKSQHQEIESFTSILVLI